MTIEVILTPILGAIIGYFTNWLAIKMIFKPYTEKRVFNIRIPFTPGLMPKERYILSKKVGNVVATKLLTDDVIVKALLTDNIHQHINSFADTTIDNLKADPRTLNDLLQKFNIITENSDIITNKLSDIIINFLNQQNLQDDIIDFIIEQAENLLKKQAKDMPIDKITDWFENVFSEYGLKYIESEEFSDLISNNIEDLSTKLSENSDTIGATISDEITEKIKVTLLNKIPTVSQLLFTLLETPIIEQKLKEMITNLINDNVSKLVTVFVSPSKIAESIVDSFKEYLSNEDNYIKTYDMIIAYFNKISEMKINELTDKIPKDYKEYPISDIIVSTIRKACTEENLSKILKSINENIIKLDDKNIYDIITNIEPNIKDISKNYLKEQFNNITANNKFRDSIFNVLKFQLNKITNLTISEVIAKIQLDKINFIKKTIIDIYDFIVKKYMISVLSTIDIANIVEQKINDFEIQEAEDIVLNVVNKELKAITLLGGLLGLIIGFLPILMQQI